MGRGSLGLNVSCTFFPRRLADRKVLCSESDKPPFRKGWLGSNLDFSAVFLYEYIDPNVLLTRFSLFNSDNTFPPTCCFYSVVLIFAVPFTFHISLFFGK